MDAYVISELQTDITIMLLHNNTILIAEESSITSLELVKRLQEQNNNVLICGRKFENGGIPN